MSSVHTENRIEIRAPSDVVFRLAADVLNWPAILEHYRYVQLVPGAETPHGGRLVKMGASRNGIPVSWTSVQEAQPESGCIQYRHVAGVTKGMDVTWRVVPTPDGTAVTIYHQLESPRWWLRSRLAAYVVGELFVKNIADKTLRGIRNRAEEVVARGR